MKWYPRRSAAKLPNGCLMFVWIVCASTSEQYLWNMSYIYSSTISIDITCTDGDCANGSLAR
jgi:hypothetical protein